MGRKSLFISLKFSKFVLLFVCLFIVIIGSFREFYTRFEQHCLVMSAFHDEEFACFILRCKCMYFQGITSYTLELFSVLSRDTPAKNQSGMGPLDMLLLNLSWNRRTFFCRTLIVNAWCFDSRGVKRPEEKMGGGGGGGASFYNKGEYSSCTFYLCWYEFSPIDHETK